VTAAQHPPAVPSPSGLSRGVVVLLGLAAAVVVVTGLRSMASLLGPAFLALTLTIATHPLNRWLAARWPRWLATTTCLVLVWVLLLGLSVILVISAARFASMLPQYEDQFADLVDDLTAHLKNAGVSSEQIAKMSSSLGLGGLTDFIASAVAGLFEVVSSLAFVVILLLFMFIDGGTFPRHLAMASAVRPQLVGALSSFAQATRRYLVVSTVFGLIVAVLDTIALAILDVPAPLLWGLLAFLTNSIPNIGFVIGLIPPAILALLDSGPGLMLAVIAVYCVLNVVIQSGIQPKVVGDAVGLSSTLSFLSLVFWAWVLGPLGAVLAIPLSLLVRAVLLDADPNSRWLAVLVANRED
jgi:AI-2 transport protein TqsA